MPVDPVMKLINFVMKNSLILTVQLMFKKSDRERVNNLNY